MNVSGVRTYISFPLRDGRQDKEKERLRLRLTNWGMVAQRGHLRSNIG